MRLCPLTSENTLRRHLIGPFFTRYSNSAVYSNSAGSEPDFREKLGNARQYVASSGL